MGYKIFIDHQFKTLYNGEFVDWIQDNIISPLKSFDLTISNNEEETKNLLFINNFDIVIITGYSSSTLAYIKFDKDNPTKTISIIYDCNAEKLIEIYDNENLGDIIAYKSRLIFLSNVIITPNKIVEEEIRSLYSGYKNLGIDINKKIHTIKFSFENNNNKELKRLIDSKYMLILQAWMKMILKVTNRGIDGPMK